VLFRSSGKLRDAAGCGGAMREFGSEKGRSRDDCKDAARDIQALRVLRDAGYQNIASEGGFSRADRRGACREEAV